jgi:hydrogenase/urease accessory protein HupE
MTRFLSLRFCSSGFFSDFDIRISNFRSRPRSQLGWILPILLAATAERAEAHLVNTGLGPFYDGLSHLFISPEDLLAVLALGLLAGLGGPRYGRLVLFSLTGAWMAGGFVGLAQRSEMTLQLAVILPFLVAGALVALDRRLPVGVVIGLAVGLGLAHGFLNGTAMVAARIGTLGLVGIGSAVFIMTAIVAAFVVWLQAAWARIGVRVAGSWIAAIGLLMLGWVAKGQ